MVIFRRSKSEPVPEFQARRRFLPSLRFPWKSKTEALEEPATVDMIVAIPFEAMSEEILDPVETVEMTPKSKFNFDALRRPVSRAVSLKFFRRPASQAVAIESVISESVLADSEMPRALSISSIASSVYSDQDQASVRSMPSLTTDEVSPPDSPIDFLVGSRPSSGDFQRPATSYEKPTNFDQRPATSYDLSTPLPLFQRQNSFNSHRSFRIQRDSFRPPTSLPSMMEKPTEPTIAEDHCLVLTMTSKYPTGIAAELYVPEDLSYDVVMRKKKDEKRRQRRESLNYEMFRRSAATRPTVDKDLEKKRAKRMSVNF